MNVLFVMNSLGGGGAERSLSEMLPELERRGVDPTLAVLRAREIRQRRIAESYRVHALRSRTLPSLTLELRSLIERVRPDLVHTAIFEADVVGRLAAAGRVPVLTSLVNETYSEERLRDPRVRAGRLHAARALDALTAHAFGDLFHAVTENVRESYAKALRLDPTKIEVIWRGRSRERLGYGSSERRSRVRKALEIPSESLVFVSVGRQEYQKDHLSLLEAFASLKDLKDRELWLIGRDGKMTPTLRKRVREFGLVQRVRFWGHREDVPDLVAASDVFVFPSLFEGFGGALVEALALEVPVITTPAMRGVVSEHHAVIVPRRSPDALAQAMRVVAQDQGLRQRLATAGLRLFEENCAMSAVGERMTRLFERAARRPPRWSKGFSR